MVQTPPAMALGFDDTSRTHGDALARAFAESPPSNLAGDPPARFSPVKHAVSNGDSHPVRVPEALEEAMRLQSLERFARRKETEARTMSPLRKAEVRESRARSVCGTGVAERKTLGSASKLKIDAVVRAGAQRPETFGRRRAGAPGVRDCADSIQGVHHKSGRFEKPGSALDFARNDHDGGAVSRALGSARAAALAPAAPALRADRGWSEAGNENRPSMRAPREGHARNARARNAHAVGESASYLSLPSSSSLASERAENDASGDAAAAPNRCDPRDSARERSLFLQRQDTAFDADQLKDLESRVSRASPPETGARLATEKEKEKGEGSRSEGNFSEAFLRSPSPGETNDGTSAREREATPTPNEKKDAGDTPGVLEALLAAGAAVRALSLEERKELFEVAVQEQVAALTHQLFPPEDGLNPRVHVDVAV